MKKLLSGVRQFQQTYVPSNRALLAELSKGQHPRVLFIACSDSRVDPSIICQADIGDLFVIRNAGNIVPPYEATNGGEGATIEYALEALDIKQIIVCGHTYCGAMKGLLQLGELEEKMPLVHDWLRHTAATHKLVQDNYSHLNKEERLEALVAENVLTQIENLRTYPVVRSKMFRDDLSIHAWVYNIETGEILAYDADAHAYVAPHSKIFPERDLASQQQLREASAERATAIASATPPVKSSAPVPAHFPGASRLSREQAERIYRGSAAR
ncbi:carbonic anhydrase [filamentous cyanobacterium CCP5]|nr:carbonic anhydrase [filamentous cyanobacterium CCP5]